MWWYKALCRLLMLAVTGATCIWLAALFGPWLAIVIWTVGMGALCAGVALLLHAQPPGKVSIINRAAGIVCPRGYGARGGKLRHIVMVSWSCWALLGMAFVMMAPGYGVGAPISGAFQRGPLMTTLLLASWIVAAGVLGRLTRIAVERGQSTRDRSVMRLTLGVSVLIAASVALALFAQDSATTWVALALTAGPLVVIGGGYGLVLLMMLTVGRKARWN